jgi:hypothetical protein
VGALIIFGLTAGRLMIFFLRDKVPSGSAPKGPVVEFLDALLFGSLTGLPLGIFLASRGWSRPLTLNALVLGLPFAVLGIWATWVLNRPGGRCTRIALAWHFLLLVIYAVFVVLWIGWLIRR